MLKISRKHGKWIMQLPIADLSDSPKAQAWADPLAVGRFDDIIKQIVEELDDRPGVRRTSYDTWVWANEHELHRFITFYYLKYGTDVSN